MTMICSDIFEQMEYENGLAKIHPPEDIKIIPLWGEGRVYFVREK